MSTFCRSRAFKVLYLINAFKSINKQKTPYKHCGFGRQMRNNEAELSREHDSDLVPINIYCLKSIISRNSL